MSILNRKTLTTTLLAAVSATAIASAASAQGLRHTHPRAHHNVMMMVQPQSPAVFHGEEYIGADPDANIRLDLQRDTGIDNSGG